jgi:2-(1,2-epoxy-1,2-dihydrophenyl)acetyl-CoA isomerase
MSTYINFEIKGGAGHIYLNRPDVLNSFNRQMAMELQEALDACNDNAAIRAVLITGNGRAFCAGQDLAEAVSPDGPGLENIVKHHYNPIIKKIRNMAKPVVCAVNGVAAGAGANIALACDLVLASANASFIQAFSKIGLIPDSGGTFFLPRLIGMQRAAALMMLGEKISATEAAAMGMIYKVFEGSQLMEEALALTNRLSLMPTKGLGYTKRALNLSLFNNLDDQLDVEAQFQTAAGQTTDYKEGVAAFLEKRNPVFTGV